MRKVCVFTVAFVACLFLTASCLADDFEDFQQAQNAYRTQDYELAMKRFESLVGGPTPVLRNPALVLEARKYLAASYLFQKRRSDAIAQFERLLAQDPTYELDPIEFPTAVLDVFSSVQRKYLDERNRILEERQQAEASADAQKKRTLAQRKAGMDRLFELAETETIEKHNSRWLAAIPFGVGQFQNGDDEWGWFFLGSEAAMLAASVVSFAIYQTIEIPPLVEGAAEPQDRAPAEQAEAIWFGINVGSVALFALLATTGIVDAQVQYQPTKVVRRKRKLDPALRSLRAQGSAGALRWYF